MFATAIKPKPVTKETVLVDKTVRMFNSGEVKLCFINHGFYESFISKPFVPDTIRQTIIDVIYNVLYCKYMGNRDNGSPVKIVDYIKNEAMVYFIDDVIDTLEELDLIEDSAMDKDELVSYITECCVNVSIGAQPLDRKTLDTIKAIEDSCESISIIPSHTGTVYVTYKKEANNGLVI